MNVNCETTTTTTSTSVTTDLKLGNTEVWLFFVIYLFEKFSFKFIYQKKKSSVKSDKKPHTPSHPLTAIQAKTTTTTLPHNLKFQQQPKNFKLAKTLKENVDTLTTTTTASSTVTTQTSSHSKSKGNSNTFFKLRKKIRLGKTLLIDIFLDFLILPKKKF